jgi:hypothetical protein
MAIMKTCENCGLRFEPSDKFHKYQRYCSTKCKDKAYKKRTKTRRQLEFKQLHEKLILALGGRCVACGIDDLCVLTIDHINDDRHGKRNDGYFMQKMVNHIEEARKLLQVLCWNHNAMKQFHREEFNRRFPHLKILPPQPIRYIEVCSI